MVDIINSLFVFAAVVMAGLDVRQVLRDGMVRGVHTLTMVLFSLWACWDVYFYGHFHQYQSMAVCCVLVVLRFVWAFIGITSKFKEPCNYKGPYWYE